MTIRLLLKNIKGTHIENLSLLTNYEIAYQNQSEIAFT